MTPSSRRFEALVVGAGLNGLASAYHLARLGCRSVALLERFELGHVRGSSHGSSRITRSSYGSETYVRLMRVANQEEWPRLERDAGQTLVHRCDGVFFGPEGGEFEAYGRTVSACGVEVEPIDVAEARRRFPALTFAGAEGALHDHTAGVVAAADTLASLAGLVARAGVTLFERTRVLGLDLARDPIELETEHGAFEADCLVVTAGPWTAALLPGLRQRLTTIRQTVAYARFAGAMADFGLGRFPVWASIGAGPNQLHYGLPEFGRPGVKLGRHVTVDRNDDPEIETEPDPNAIEELRAFAAEQFASRLEQVLAAETCFYTVTPSEDYVIGLHPENARVAIGAGFSGHGFKLGPVTGRILAELALTGRSTVAEFESRRALFAIT